MRDKFYSNNNENNNDNSNGLRILAEISAFPPY